MISLYRPAQLNNAVVLPALRLLIAESLALEVHSPRRHCRAAGAKKILGVLLSLAAISQCQMAFGPSRRMRRHSGGFH